MDKPAIVQKVKLLLHLAASYSEDQPHEYQEALTAEMIAYRLIAKYQLAREEYETE